MKTIFYIVDVRNLIVENQPTLERHMKYADILQLRTMNEVSLGVIRFKQQKSVTLKLQENLQILSIPSNPLFMIRSLRSYKFEKNKDETVKVLIAGDPWESTLCAHVLKLVHFKTAKIQVQIHGDIGNESWIRLTSKNFIRGFIARFSLRLANQFRTVGVTQTNLLISKYRIPKARCRIIPVSSMYSSNPITSNNVNPASLAIGFVGRLQSDRGIDKFLELVAKLRQKNLLFSVIVAGDGPESESFEIELEKILPRENIKFLGNLKPTEMVEAWSQIGILVSTAPTESFGRAIREAIAWGIPVWAIPSSGVSDLQIEVSQLYVKNLDIDLPAERQVEICRELLSAEIPLEVRKRIIEADRYALDSLIESWIELSK